MAKHVIEVMSHKDFDYDMKMSGLNDDNVENVKDIVFISIIGTEDCNKYYLNEPDTKHWFSKNHTNVLNLEFDDISEDREYKGHLFKALSIDQAKQIVEFINRNINDGAITFKIHCRAGISRSRAVGEFIAQLIELDGEVDYHGREQYINHLNVDVLTKLKRIYKEEYYEKFN